MPVDYPNPQRELMSDTTSTVTATPDRAAPILVAALLLVDGLHFVFARALANYLPPPLSAFLVIAVATLEVAAYAVAQGKFHWAGLRRNLWFSLTIGALAGAATVISFAAVEYIDPGTAALLNEMSIVVGILLGVFWLKEHLPRRQVLGIAVSLVGVGIITFQPGDYLRIGALMILVSSTLYAMHTAVVKRHGEHIEFVEFFLWRLASMAAFLALAATAFRAWQWPSPAAWLVVLVAGTVDVVISRALYYLALRRLKMSMFSIVLTVSPVVAILWTWGLFGIGPTLQQLLGGLAVVIGIAIVTMTRSG